MIVVSDTSPITYLLQINHVHLLPQLFRSVVIPLRVYEELCEIEEQKKWLSSTAASWLEIKQVSDQNLVQQFNIVLDSGESEAIVLAKELKADAILIDEWKGRTIAIEQGLSVTGIMGVLLEAKQQDLISAVKPAIDNLMHKGFRISENVYKEVLLLAKE